MSCAEHDEFNYVELIFYKVGQSLTVSRITKCNNFIKKGQEMEQSIHSKVEQSLLHRAAFITKKDALLQSGDSITNWDKS